MQTHTQMHTRAHTHTHKHAHTHMHAYTHTLCAYVCVCVCVCVCMCVCVHVREWMHACVRAYMHACVHVYVFCPALHLLQMLPQMLTIVLFFMWAQSLLQSSNKQMTGIVLILVMFVTWAVSLIPWQYLHGWLSKRSPPRCMTVMAEWMKTSSIQYSLLNSTAVHADSVNLGPILSLP